MKSTRNLRILSLVLAGMFLFVSFSAFAEGGIVKTDLYAIADEIYQNLIFGHFDKVISLYEQYPDLVNNGSVYTMYQYARARKNLQDGEMVKASMLFEALKDYNDSDKYYSYCQGRIAESESRFEDAYQFYLNAAGLSTLDCIERMQNCYSRIGEEKQEKAYQEALQNFDEVKDSNESAMLSKVLKQLQALGAYKDAAEYAVQCESLLKAASRKISLNAVPSPTEISLSWKDNEPDHQYNVIFGMPDRKARIRQELCASPTVLKDLLPDTVYTVRVEDASDAMIYTEASVTTESADFYSDGEIQFNQSEIAGISRFIKDKSPADIFNMYPEAVLRPDNNTLNNADISKNIFYSRFSFVNVGGKELQVSFLPVVRTESFGVFSAEPEECLLPAGERMQMVCISLDDILEEIRQEAKRIPAGQYSLEMYMNGKLLFSELFSIE